MDVAPLETICRAYQLAFIVVVGQFPEKENKMSPLLNCFWCFVGMCNLGQFADTNDFLKLGVFSTFRFCWEKYDLNDSNYFQL